MAIIPSNIMKHGHDNYADSNFDDSSELGNSGSEKEASESDNSVEHHPLQHILNEWAYKHSSYNCAGMPFGAEGFELWAHYDCGTTSN